MNPEQKEVLEARRIVLKAQIDCLMSAREEARERGDAVTFLATDNQYCRAWEELHEVEKPLRQLAAEEHRRRQPPDDPLNA